MRHEFRGAAQRGLGVRTAGLVLSSPDQPTITTMAHDYHDRLLQQLAAYRRAELGDAAEPGATANDDERARGHVLPKDAARANILPGIRDAFWSWFDALEPPHTLDASFHDLGSSQALAFNLFFPFLKEGRADRRLLTLLGLKGGEYMADFGKAVDAEESASFDFYMESASGQRICFELELAGASFGSAESDAAHVQMLERHYRPCLHDLIDAKWLEPAAFCAHYTVMRTLSCLGRYADSGVVFIFPRANERLKEEEQAIKQIVSKSLAPRVAILYLEYLVERILNATAGDDALHEHFLRFRAKYICL